MINIQSFFSPLRLKIPYLFDVVIVSNPEHIRKIEASGDVDRLHKYDTVALPWWVRFYFQATRFHDHERDLWFCALESTSNPSYQHRRAYLDAKISTGYTQQDVSRIADLLKANADDEALAHEMVKIVNRRFFGEDIPLSITRIAKHTLKNLGEAIWPWKYTRAKKSQQQTMDYCARFLPQDVHILDVGHNFGEIVQTTTRALRILQDNLDRPVEEIFTLHALTAESARIVVKSSTFDGLLWLPTRAGKTVIIFKIKAAAAETGNIYFTFGTGGTERVCVFKEFFLDFMNDLQGVLRETESQGRG